MSVRLCDLPECDERHFALGYCRLHWRRFKRKGDPRDAGQLRNATAEQRFAIKFHRGAPDECWEWIAGRGPDNYGIFWAGDRYPSGQPVTVGAHRYAYLTFIGPIPQGHEVCHSCDNPPCVNPAHLYTDTHANNSARSWKLGRNKGMPGEMNGRAKLTAEDVRHIRETYTGKRGELVGFARRYEVATITIANVLARKSWVDDSTPASGS